SILDLPARFVRDEMRSIFAGLGLRGDSWGSAVGYFRLRIRSFSRLSVLVAPSCHATASEAAEALRVGGSVCRLRKCKCLGRSAAFRPLDAIRIPSPRRVMPTRVALRVL